MLVPRVWEDRAAAALRPLRPGPELLKPETGLLLLLLSWADASAVLITASVDTFAVTADGSVVDSAVTAAVSANVSAADSAADPKDAAAVSAVTAAVSATDLLMFLLILKILLLFLPSLLLLPPAIRARSRCHVLPSKPPPKSRSPSCSSEL